MTNSSRVTVVMDDMPWDDIEKMMTKVNTEASMLPPMDCISSKPAESMLVKVKDGYIC